jgi:hypothetical protein
MKVLDWGGVGVGGGGGREGLSDAKASPRLGPAEPRRWPWGQVGLPCVQPGVSPMGCFLNT